MRQVFQNLFANALKYHGAEPPLIRVSGEVAAQDGPERVRVLVRDNGIGFDERHLDRIFKPFQRLHGKNAYEGTGIGLAIVRKIVERHGGTVTAESRPGAGSTFIIELPRRHRDAIQTRIGTTG
jgi:signal transduction histidine kinase